MNDIIPLSSISSPKSRKSILALCTSYRSLCEQEDEIKKIKAELMKVITPLANSLGLSSSKLKGPGFLLVHNTKSTPTIKAERLLEKGVKIDIIKYATVTKKSEYYTVLASKDDEKG